MKLIPTLSRENYKRMMLEYCDADYTQFMCDRAYLDSDLSISWFIQAMLEI